MNNYEFLEILYNDLNGYFGCLIICILIYCCIFWRVINSILDPLLIAIIHSCLASVIPVFLYSHGYIKPEHFFQFIATQTAFFIGFLLPIKFFSRYRLNVYDKVTNLIKSPTIDDGFLGNTIIPFLLLVTLQVGVYLQNGIPLFMVSRLEAYEGGSGFGIFARIIEILQMFVSFFAFSYLLIGRKMVPYLVSVLIILILIIFCILSGSKGSFLSLASMIFAVVITFTKESNASLTKKVRKISFFVVSLAVLVITLILLLQTGTESSTVPLYLAFGLRLVSDGDVFWYSYPYETFQYLPSTRGIEALFADLLGFLRVVSWDNLPKVIGIQLMSIHHPSDHTFGPNARHNVFGLVYFSTIGSIVFSLILGLVLGISRWVVFQVKWSSSYLFLFTYLLYTKFCILETDPMLALTGINNCLFFFLPICLIAIFSKSFVK